MSFAAIVSFVSDYERRTVHRVYYDPAIFSNNSLRYGILYEHSSLLQNIKRLKIFINHIVIQSLEATT